ncbi:MAG: hypothetical protein M0006_15720 [Magnetospirillum sp.]|nr:hypothetical protein [Magnetospirillum sp.]
MGYVQLAGDIKTEIQGIVRTFQLVIRQKGSAEIWDEAMERQLPLFTLPAGFPMQHLFDVVHAYERGLEQGAAEALAATETE